MFEMDPSVALAELHAALAQLQAEGAMDEEGPFIRQVLDEIRVGKMSPNEALVRVQTKLQSRNDYH